MFHLPKFISLFSCLWRLFICRVLVRSSLFCFVTICLYKEGCFSYPQSFYSSGLETDSHSCWAAQYTQQLPQAELLLSIQQWIITWIVSRNTSGVLNIYSVPFVDASSISIPVWQYSSAVCLLYSSSQAISEIFLSYKAFLHPKQSWNVLWVLI